MNYGYRDGHNELLDRFGQALAIYDRWPTKDNRALVDAAHLAVIDSSLRWGYGKGVARVVPMNLQAGEDVNDPRQRHSENGPAPARRRLGPVPCKPLA